MEIYTSSPFLRLLIKLLSPSWQPTNFSNSSLSNSYYTFQRQWGFPFSEVAAMLLLIHFMCYSETIIVLCEMYSPIGLIQYRWCWGKFYPHMRIRGIISDKKFGKLFPAGGRIDIGKQNTNAYLGITLISPSTPLSTPGMELPVSIWTQVLEVQSTPCKHQ